MVATVLSIAAVIVAVGVTAAAVAAVLRLTQVRSGAEEDVQKRVAALELKVDQLPSAWELAVQRAEQALEQAGREHSRARAARSTAERALRERQELDANPDLFDGDEEGGGAEGVPPMRRGVAQPPPAAGTGASWPPGLSPFELEGLA